IAQPDEPDEPGESDTETGRQGDKKEDDLATVAVSPGSPVPSSVSGLPGGHSAADMLLGGALPKPPRPPFFHQFRVLT
ncbi:hypothetical protein, partial [Klebsiella pneumoniae]|uniref:hypothetical protein n=1 Tax=Klebsiella pneumoniae TaxID=573 RepID=UPI0025A09B7B